MLYKTEDILAVLNSLKIFGIIEKLEWYQGVLLAYDPDIDQRLKQIVDQMHPYFRGDLQVVHECDGVLSMIWTSGVPKDYAVGNSMETQYHDGSFDYWHIGYAINLDVRLATQIRNPIDRFDISLN